MLAAAADHKRRQGGVQALFAVEFLVKCFFHRPHVSLKQAAIKPRNNWVLKEPGRCRIVRQVAIAIAGSKLLERQEQIVGEARANCWRGKSELLEREVHGTVMRATKATKRKQSTLDELREELAAAREKLVEAVSQRSRENVLAPLRNKVGELLERIERLCSAERFRR
jgi:hypothetical protein